MNKDSNTIYLLQNLLANEYIFFTKLYKFHWNVKGPFFGSLHKLFEEGYRESFEIVDLIAERIQQLGYFADGTLTDFLEKGTISEEPQINPDSISMIKILIKNLEIIINQLRKLIEDTLIKDLVTNNFLMNLSEKHEKYLWILKSHLE